MLPLPRGVSTFCPNLCSLPLHSLSPFILQSRLSLYTHCVFLRSRLLLFDCQKLLLPCLAPSASPEMASQRDELPPCRWLDGRGSGQAAYHIISGMASGKESSLSWGQAFPIQGFIRPDRGSWLIFPGAKASLPRAARNLDIKMSAAGSSPGCMLARRRRGLLSSSCWPCQGMRVEWESV